MSGLVFSPFCVLKKKMFYTINVDYPRFAGVTLLGYLSTERTKKRNKRKWKYGIWNGKNLLS